MYLSIKYSLWAMRENDCTWEEPEQGVNVVFPRLSGCAVQTPAGKSEANVQHSRSALGGLSARQGAAGVFRDDTSAGSGGAREHGVRSNTRVCLTGYAPGRKRLVTPVRSGDRGGAGGCFQANILIDATGRPVLVAAHLGPACGPLWPVRAFLAASHAFETGLPVRDLCAGEWSTGDGDGRSGAPGLSLLVGCPGNCSAQRAGRPGRQHITALVVLYLIAVWAVITGMLQFTQALGGRSRYSPLFLGIAGVASLILGLVLFVISPLVALLSLIRVIGICALVCAMRAFFYRAWARRQEDCDREPGFLP